MGELRDLVVRVRWSNVARLGAVATVAVLALRALAGAGSPDPLPPAAGVRPVAPPEPRTRLEPGARSLAQKRSRPERPPRRRAERPGGRRAEIRGQRSEVRGIPAKAVRPPPDPPPALVGSPSGGEFAP